MAKSQKPAVGRRGFLRGAALGAAALVAKPGAEAAAAALPLAQAAAAAPPPARVDVYTTDRPGSDFADKGKQVYMKQNCYYCHGTVGQGGRDGARLYNTSLTADGLIRYVRKPAGAMPAFTEKILADQDLRDIFAYLKSLPTPKAPKEIPLLEQSRER